MVTMSFADPLRPVFVALATLALLFGLAGPASGVVLCVGDDGHTEVESALDECCMGGGGEVGRPALTERSNHRSVCTGCTDLMITLPTTLREDGGMLAVGPGPPAAPTAVWGATLRAQRTCSRPVPVRDQVPAAARSGTVLLI